MSIMDIALPDAEGAMQEPAAGDLQALGLDELAVDAEAARVVGRLTRTDRQGGPAPVRTAAFNAYI